MRTRAALLIVAGLGVGGVVALVRGRAPVSTGRAVPGGVLIGDTGRYDLLSRLLLAPLFRAIAVDVAAAVPSDAKILEIGCGPGLLAIQLARSHGFDVTGLDLDPAMIERARANAVRSTVDDPPCFSFVVGDVAALPFDDATFDAVVSTFSMHHWSDRARGLEEIARVLVPGGQALIWDLRPGGLPFHPDVRDAAETTSPASLIARSAGDWRWPGRLSFAQRIEFERM